VEREAQAMTHLESIRVQADRAGNAQVQEHILRAMISLQPQVGALQLQLIEQLWATGQREACWQQLQPLIADNQMSHPSARLWFVRNSLQPAPLQALTSAERVDQLQKVVESEPKNSEALALLAEAYLSLGEPALAERTFVKAADADSGMNRQLLSFYQASGRPMQERRRFELHLQHLQQKFRDTPGNPDVITELVRFQVLMGQHSEALLNIAELRATGDSDQLKRLEAEVRLARVGLISRSAFLRIQTMIDDVETAMLLAPDSLDPLSLAVVMKVSDGAEFDQRVVNEVLDHWLKLDRSDDFASCGKGMALVLAEKHDEAAVSLRKVESLSPAMYLALIHALRRSGTSDDALTVAPTAVASAGSLATPSLKRQAALFWAAAGASENAWTAIPAAAGTELDPELEAFIALMQFDQATNYPGDLADAQRRWQPATTMVTPEILSLLQTALRQSETQSAAARRLYRLRASVRPSPPGFDNWLFELRAELGDPGQLLLILGTMGLYEESWDDSLYWLDAAVRTTGARSVAALNNLAIAIVRSRTRARYQEALTLVNSALHLNPQNAELLASRGEVAMALEQWESARTDLENVLTVHPDHTDALRLLPTVYTALGDHAAATALRRRQKQSVTTP
jgi:tetratricopeptide (TPR) repeat protein